MDDKPDKKSKADFNKQEQERTFAIHAVISFVAALGILVAAIVLFIVLVATKKDPKQSEGEELVSAVRVQPIVVSDHRVSIDTQGVISSLREVRLAAEVGGRVTVRSPKLVEGETVSAGELLLEIDATNYKAAEARAASAVADAKVALQQEQAMAEQAVIDWQKLGRGEPTDLVLRKPQLAAAKARLESAEAELLRAQEDVKRTRILAPFDARVRMASVEVGAVLAPGTLVAELYSPDELEVRLPFTLLDYGFLSKEENVEIKLSATLGGELKTWPAVMDRVDGEVQRSTLSAYGLARVKPDANGQLPPVGLFVEAVVPGMELEDVVVMPRSAVRGTNEVWVARESKLAKAEITILRSGRSQIVARGAFQAEDQLVLTRLAAPMSGMKVETVGEDTDRADEKSP